jgi:hypothetical protein
MNCRLAALMLLGSLAISTAWGGQPKSTMKLDTLISRGDSLRERMRYEDYLDRIDRKLQEDLSSTRVRVIHLSNARFPFPLKSIPVANGEPFVFEKEKYATLLYLVNEGEPVDTSSTYEIIPLAIKSQQISGGPSGAPQLGLGRTIAPVVTYPIKVHLKDIARLDMGKQRQIVDYIIERSAKGAEDSLFIPGWKNPMSPVNPNQRDYWSFAKVTDRFPVPRLEPQEPVIRFDVSRPEGTSGSSMVGDTIRIGGKTANVDTSPFLQWTRVDFATRYFIAIASGSAIVRKDTTTADLIRLANLENSKSYNWSVSASVPRPGRPDSITSALYEGTFTTLAPPQSLEAEALDPADRLGYTIDASFSRIALSHEALHSESALGIPRFGVEVGFDDPILSLLPYQAPVISYGAVLFFNATSEQTDILDRKFLQLKFMGRSRFNADRFCRDLGAFKYIFTPLITSGGPTLNVAVPGFGFEIMTSKLGSLPYLNFLYAGGSKTYENPVYASGPTEHRLAYWSSMQWRGSMAFYFNLESDPEYYISDPTGKHLNIIRLDLGAGTYNVAAVEYDKDGRVLATTGVVKASRIQPYLAVEYVHASRVKTAFGVRAAYFDNRIDLLAWISLFKIGRHELRLEGTDIFGPFGRALFAWENSGSALMQFRYRLGF